MQAGGNISRPFCNCWSRIFAQKTNSRRRADTYVCVWVCVLRKKAKNVIWRTVKKIFFLFCLLFFLWYTTFNPVTPNLLTFNSVTISLPTFNSVTHNLPTFNPVIPSFPTCSCPLQLPPVPSQLVNLSLNLFSLSFIVVAV